MAYLWLCKSPSLSLKLMDFPGNVPVSRVPLVGKSWATRWFSQNVGSLQVPWVSISSYRCSFPNCEIGSNLLLLYSTQSFMSLAPIRVNWGLGTFACKAFAHLLISQLPMAMVLKTFKNIRKSPDAVAAQHTIFFSLGVRRASTWRCQQKKRGNFWVTPFWCKNPNQKKMVRNWFLFASWKPWSPQIPWE